ncbi:SDR family NAD(P)-dependent oxidoreductase [Bacillus xiapuensis]|uniref:SDR family NAD(P)-dependent oxidoreductase n=1 Tax=Bacillus xiapuensis TaxID=2014075 RepID=UPI000C24B4DD|nr:SDR family oxidoreductase [Bacillus xiapuensis]
MNRLRRKTVIITGASSGLGREMAKQAVAEGARVVLLARRIKRLDKLKEALEKDYPGSDVRTYRVDISRRADVENRFAEILADINEVDVLINNAGFGVFDEAHEAKWEDIETMFQVNVLGLISCTQMVLPYMKARKSGHIINIASQAGKMATPKSSVYAATKHAVLGYTNSLRMEAARDGIYVTAVNPGPIATDFLTIADRSGSYAKRVARWLLQPEKVAAAVIHAIGTDKREINLPKLMNAGSLIYALFPRTVERIGRKAFFKK